MLTSTVIGTGSVTSNIHPERSELVSERSGLVACHLEAGAGDDSLELSRRPTTEHLRGSRRQERQRVGRIRERVDA